jgi:RNA polymerase sigma factor (sigma-70 family)
VSRRLLPDGVETTHVLRESPPQALGNALFFAVTLGVLATYTGMQQTSHVASHSVAHDSAEPGFLSWVAELVRNHRGRLVGYARRRGLGPEESLDAVQDSFTSFLTLPEARNIARSGDDSLKVLTVILRNNVLNHRRKHNRRERGMLLALAAPADDAGTSEQLVASVEELVRINGCIQRMAELQRAVIMLSLVDDLSHDETAKLLGVSAGYVRVLLHRAREHVRACTFDG